MAPKTGTSESATGTVTDNTVSRLSFATTVTSLIIQNNVALDVGMYVRLNEDLDTYQFDFWLPSWGYLILLNDEIEVAFVSVHATDPGAGTATFTMPHYKLIVKGWS